jgi:hypothetical protein
MVLSPTTVGRVKGRKPQNQIFDNNDLAGSQANGKGTPPLLSVVLWTRVMEADGSENAGGELKQMEVKTQRRS